MYTQCNDNKIIKHTHMNENAKEKENENKNERKIHKLTK
jgi:hypothetical protein